MNSFFQQLVQQFPMLLRYLCYAGLILFISLFFPSGAQFEYNYKYGERWNYNTLTAPFDFPLLKSQEDLQREKQLVQENTKLYYRLNTESVAIQQDSFKLTFAMAFPTWRDSNVTLRSDDSMRYLNLGLSILDKVYAQKLIHIDSLHLPMENDFICNLVEENVDLGEYERTDFIESSRALTYIIDTISKVTREYTNARFLIPMLSERINYPNVVFDEALTVTQNQQELNKILEYRGMVKAGELIVTYGGVVDSTIYVKLNSLEHKYNHEIKDYKDPKLIYAGYLILTIALLVIYFLFIEFYVPEVIYKLRNLGLPIMMIAGYAYLSFLINQSSFFSEYVIPFCIVPIVILNFYSYNFALFTHIVIVVLCSMLLSLDYQFILVQLIVGMVAILTKLKTRYLTDFFTSLFYIAIVYTAGFVSLELIHSGTIFDIKDANGELLQKGVRWDMLGWIALNVFFTLLSYPIIPLLEKIFGLTSEITLVELSDMNKPLLKELSIRASGTLQHSLQVAHLSEAAANSIHANALLVRVAALYHDIGKIKNPSYFIENQEQDNPHEDLTPLESAKIIISHVSEGIRLARKHALPEIIIGFIRTHHGTTKTEYFYRQYKQEHPEDTDKDDYFVYPGPCPRTREEAILMLADSLEAASRTLVNPTTTDIDELVESIIKSKIARNQLNNTNLSFKELETIKVVFKQLLKTIRHARIDYPEEIN